MQTLPPQFNIQVILDAFKSIKIKAEDCGFLARALMCLPFFVLMIILFKSNLDFSNLKLALVAVGALSTIFFSLSTATDLGLAADRAPNQYPSGSGLVDVIKHTKEIYTSITPPTPLAPPRSPLPA